MVRKGKAQRRRVQGTGTMAIVVSERKPAVLTKRPCEEAHPVAIDAVCRDLAAERRSIVSSIPITTGLGARGRTCRG